MKANELKRKWRKDADDTMREMNMDDKRLNERCPYIRTLRGGDETQDVCDLVDKWCLIEHSQYECEIWNGIRLRDKEGKQDDIYDDRFLSN